MAETKRDHTSNQGERRSGRSIDHTISHWDTFYLILTLL